MSISCTAIKSYKFRQYSNCFIRVNFAEVVYTLLFCDFRSCSTSHALYFECHNLFVFSPVLLSKKHFDDEKPKFEDSEPDLTSACEWVIQPMLWGLVPQWHQGDVKHVGLSLNNARSDGMLSKNTFKVPLERGQRCVVLVDGSVSILLNGRSFLFPMASF